jgi:hypothetical protein
VKNSRIGFYYLKVEEQGDKEKSKGQKKNQSFAEIKASEL